MAKGKKPVDNTPICDRAYLRRIDPRWVPAPVPKYFWEDETHRRDYLLWLANRLGFRGMADFYRLEISKTCKRNGGSGVIKHWGTSAYAAVQDCFPEYDWKPWLFVQVSPGFWDSPANRRSYLDWLGNELGFRRPEDWYRIESAEILRRHGSSLIHSFPSLYDLMREYLPQLEWDRIDRYRPIRVEEILAWADAHRAAHGTLPTREAGEIPQSGDTWSAINRCLQYGFRGLPGGSTLIRLLKKHRGLPIGRRLPELSEEQVLAWADAYFAAQGKWPTENSGPIPGTKETWSAVAAAMRGLPGLSDSLVIAPVVGPAARSADSQTSSAADAAADSRLGRRLFRRPGEMAHGKIRTDCWHQGNLGPRRQGPAQGDIAAFDQVLWPNCLRSGEGGETLDILRR